MRLPPFTVTVIAPLALVLVLAFATHGTSRVEAVKPAPPVIVAADDGQQRNVALEQLRLAMSETPPAIKGDRLAPPAPLADRELVPPPAGVTEATEDTPQPRRRSVVKHEKKKRSRDVCRQHGQRKVFVGKYRWRCRK